MGITNQLSAPPPPVDACDDPARPVRERQHALPHWGTSGALTVMDSSPAITAALAEVGPRLKRVRAQRDITLTELAAATGISKSTLSRLEAGQRKTQLGAAAVHRRGAPDTAERAGRRPRGRRPQGPVHPAQTHGRTVVPLTRQPGGIQAWKAIIPPEPGAPELGTHEGYEWLYVLAGQVRVILADHDITMGPGEVAEFDTRLPQLLFDAAEASACLSQEEPVDDGPGRARRLRSLTFRWVALLSGG
jgi:DNA-binding XRE family transcriptional regulator